MLTCAGIQAQDVTSTDQQAEAQTLPAEGQPATVVVNQTMKFGYLSYSQVLEAMDGYADTQKTIAALRQAYEQELARSEEVFSKQFSEYVDGQKSFPDNIRLKRQKELQQTMEQSLQFKQEAKALLKQKEEAALDVLRARLNGVISELAACERDWDAAKRDYANIQQVLANGVAQLQLSETRKKDMRKIWVSMKRTSA